MLSHRQGVVTVLLDMSVNVSVLGVFRLRVCSAESFLVKIF